MKPDDLDHEARTTLFDEPDPRERRDDAAVFAPPALLPRIVRRWKPILALGVLAAVVGAGVGLASPTVYTATALVELGPGASDLVTGTPSAQQDIDRRVATETEIITSDLVRAQAEDAVGEDLPEVEVTQQTTSSLLGVAVTSGDPESAAADADAYVAAYIKLTSDRTKEQLTPAIGVLNDRIVNLSESLGDLRIDIAKPSTTGATSDALQDQYRSLLDERSSTKERIDQLKGAAALGNLDVRSFADAVPPSGPSSTPPLRLALLALLVGLVAGAVVAAAVPLGARRRPRA